MITKTEDKEEIKEEEKPKREIVIPGEVIVSGKDYLPGDGTRREGENIIANRYGLADISGRLIKIIPLSGIYMPRAGNIVIGRIEDVTFNGWLMDIKAPDLTIDNTWKKNQNYDSDFVTYIKKRKEVWNGDCNKPTLILDEIDSQLDMTNQIKFHEEILPKLLEKYQVILVSHSIFATKHENIIDLDGSLELVKQKIKEL